MTRPRAAIVGIAGPVLLAEEASLLQAFPPAGVILFARNIRDPGQLAALMKALRRVLPGEADLMVDQEGGRVARLKPPHWQAHPAAAVIGGLFAANPAAGLRAAWLTGALIGGDCRAAGFSVAAAPVLDLAVPGAHDVIGDRAFARHPVTVARLGRAVANGLLAAGVVPVGKHAPGHGRARVDSHLMLPNVADDDLSADLRPFRLNADLPWMMTAHIVYAALDPHVPATLSATVIETVIRRRIGFKGVLVTDDLAMQALSGASLSGASLSGASLSGGSQSGSPAELSRRALAAGCDIALYCSGDFPETEALLRGCPALTPAAEIRLRAGRQAATDRRMTLDPVRLAAERQRLLMPGRRGAMSHWLFDLAIAVIPVVLAITLHEAAHGYAALALGDTTARDAGRLSLNPIRHIDRVGTILLPGFLLISQLLFPPHKVFFMFGWAKPVPIGAWKFRDPRRGMALVAAAGPLMNFFLAWLAALVMPLTDFPSATQAVVAQFLWYFMLANIVLGLFNLLPIPPLDGGRIAVGLLPLSLARVWARMEKAGILVVLLVVFILPRLIDFDPVGQALNSVVPWAFRTLFWLPAAIRGIWMEAASDLVLRLEGFEGPMDLLLDLARAQKVDLAKISILSLVDQYLAVIEGARRIRLELAADWLVMAAWLTWLKSRLLVPAAADDGLETGEMAAEALAERLRWMNVVRGLAAWLAARPALGQDVFPRGAPQSHHTYDRSRVVIEAGPFVRAYLDAVRRGVKSSPYTPRALTIWTVQDALRRLAGMVGGLPDWTTLEQFLPAHLDRPMERRAALSSTLLAGLEMARGGAVRLRQDEPFGPIMVRRVHEGGHDL